MSRSNTIQMSFLVIRITLTALMYTELARKDSEELVWFFARDHSFGNRLCALLLTNLALDLFD